MTDNGVHLRGNVQNANLISEGQKLGRSVLLHARSLVPLVTARDIGMTPAHSLSGCVIPKLGAFSSRARDLAWVGCALEL